MPISFLQDAKQYSAVVDVKNLNKPLMIFIGLKDTTVPPDKTQKIIDNAKDPYVVRQEKIGHNFRESQHQAEIVWQHIKNFLGNTSGQNSSS